MLLKVWAVIGVAAVAYLLGLNDGRKERGPEDVGARLTEVELRYYERLAASPHPAAHPP